MLPGRPGVGYRCLGLCGQGFFGRCVLVPADRAAGSFVVVWRLRCFGVLERELVGGFLLKKSL